MNFSIQLNGKGRPLSAIVAEAIRPAFSKRAVIQPWENMNATRRPSATVEELELRRLLSKPALEVWGGDTDLTTRPEPWQCFYSINKQGYTRLGGTSAANATKVFASSTQYDFLVVVTRARVEIDSIRSSTNGYIPINYTGNTSSASEMDGAADGRFGVMGNWLTNEEYIGYSVIRNTNNWTGLRIVTGAIRPMIGWIDFDQEAHFLSSATAYKASVEVGFDANGFLSGARLRAPSGKWYELEKSDDTWWEYWREFRTVSALEGEFGTGVYKLELSSAAGKHTTSLSFAKSGSITPVPWPTQRPEMLAPVSGMTNMPRSATFSWKKVTDAKINAINVDVEDADDDVADFDLPSTATSVGPVKLSRSRNYEIELKFCAKYDRQTSDGYQYHASRVTRTAALFRTSSTYSSDPPEEIVPKPDLAVTALSASLSGSTVLATFSAGNLSEGNAIGINADKVVPVFHQFRLSRDRVWGNDDDVVLSLRDLLITSGHVGGWLADETLVLNLPRNLAAGSYYLGMMLDTTNVVSESRESNNLRWTSSASINIA